MKANIEISRSHLRQLLQSIDRINGVPDNDTHADVHMKINKNSMEIYSHVSPAFVSHTIEDGRDFSVDIETGGNISFNIETLANIVQKADEGLFKIEFRDHEYRIRVPGGDSFSPVKFELPRHTESVFQEPVDFGELYKIDSLPRKEIRHGLSTMEVIDEFIKLTVDDNKVVISIENKVTGDAEVEKELNATEITSLSQYYLLRPMKEFVSTISDVDEIVLLVSEGKNICLRASIDSWTAELYLAEKADPSLDTYFTI